MLEYVVAPDSENSENRRLSRRSPRLWGEYWMAQCALEREVSGRLVLRSVVDGSVFEDVLVCTVCRPGRCAARSDCDCDGTLWPF